MASMRTIREGKPHDLFSGRGKFSLESQMSTVSIGRNRNLACEQAAGEFIAYRHDHDWYASDRLCHQVASGTGGCGEPTDDGFRKDGTQPNQPPGDPGGGRRGCIPYAAISETSSNC